MSRAWEAHEQERRAMIGCERESVPQGTKHIRWDPVDQAELISRYRLRPRLVGSPHRLDSSWMRVVAQHVCLGLVVNSCVVCDCRVPPCSSSRWDWEAERICEGPFFVWVIHVRPGCRIASIWRANISRIIGQLVRDRSILVVPFQDRNSRPCPIASFNAFKSNQAN